MGAGDGKQGALRVKAGPQTCGSFAGSRSPRVAAGDCSPEQGL